MQITARGAEFTLVSLVVYASMKTYYISIFNNTLHFVAYCTLVQLTYIRKLHK